MMWGYGSDGGMMGWGYGALGISNMILWIVLVGLVVAAVAWLARRPRRTRFNHMDGDLPASTHLRNTTRAAK